MIAEIQSKQQNQIQNLCLFNKITTQLLFKFMLLPLVHFQSILTLQLVSLKDMKKRSSRLLRNIFFIYLHLLNVRYSYKRYDKEFVASYDTKERWRRCRRLWNLRNNCKFSNFWKYFFFKSKTFWKILLNFQKSLKVVKIKFFFTQLFVPLSNLFHFAYFSKSYSFFMQ